MTIANFEEFFLQATGGKRPYAFQTRLATGESLPATWVLPTGTGKTATAILTWLWRRRGPVPQTVKEATPRRLVYCLPIRSLVEQTYRVAWGMLDRLGDLGPNDGPPGEEVWGHEASTVGSAAPAVTGNALRPEGVRLHHLLGGHADDDWTLYPEADMILIGTQDMLLSRALNRGYGMSRFRWPVAFGLLNSDVLWVNDEVQLMDVGLTTTAQLAGMRRRFGTAGEARTVWMSATLRPEWLATVDHPRPSEADVFRLDEEDKRERELRKRLEAPKVLSKLDLPGEKDRYEQLAELVRAHHRRGTLTLVVLNTVERAQSLYKLLNESGGAKPRRGKSRQSVIGGAEPAETVAPEVLLLHSRFRAPDRQRLEACLRSPLDSGGPGRIVVTTQVVEAGVDISATTLISELAPWASLVQRFGRCNRYGEDQEARVFWLEVKEVVPYTAGDLAEARDQLMNLEGRSVAAAALPQVELREAFHDALRAKDLLDLFDTSPDLSGNDIDVGRFIRDSDELDVQVFWRDVPESGPDRKWPEPLPERAEVCAAPLLSVRSLLQKKQAAWVWDHLDDRWIRAQPHHVRPGVVLMLPAGAGLYSNLLGWDVTVKDPVSVSDAPPRDKGLIPEAAGSDRDSLRFWQTLSDHTDLVVTELERICGALSYLQRWLAALTVAARHHDWGKSHEVFQKTMEGACDPDEWASRNAGGPSLWAKSGGSRHLRHERPHFRHELASALALLQGGAGAISGDVLDLVAYLVAAHHGRVRLSIRSLPGEARPPQNEDGTQRRYALGVWDGDALPEVALGGGVFRPPLTLSLRAMELGRGVDGEPSWLDRMLALRDAPDLGPFRLAYLEALLRAADGRASAIPTRVPIGAEEEVELRAASA